MDPFNPEVKKEDDIDESSPSTVNPDASLYPQCGILRSIKEESEERPLTVNEALDILEDEDEFFDVYMEPPDVSIPHGIKMYNKGMGGTDRMDQNINKYRISIKSKKWWWSLFTWMLDMAVHNAWQLSKGQGSALTQLQFRREIAACYLNQFGILPKGKGRKSTTLPAQHFVRYDNLGHLVEPVQDNKKRRCANTGCTSIGRTQCSRCNVGLCVKCFRDYHTK
uniref:PiggyBac transposable element-derived protein domain-containing protein n=1 Tax=Scylla olivacea TaxID=85551 RepID=A0A0P4W9A4_SCYOL